MERVLWSRVLLICGLFGMLVGALDPLEGSVIILPCTGMAALGALLGKTRRRKLLYWALLLVAAGVGTMLGLSSIGGVGGSNGPSTWWAMLMLPYPIGWFLGLAGAILGLVGSFRQTAHPAHP